jgi:hypothetical protein
LCGNVDPALVLVAGDLRGNEADRAPRPGSRVVKCERGVDVAGDDKQERTRCRLQFRLDARGIEQPEGGIQRFAEVSVDVVVYVPVVQDDANPELAVSADRMRQAGVVAGQELAEDRDDEVDEGRFVAKVDQGEQVIAAVGEPVAWRAVTPAETCPGAGSAVP